MLVRERYQNFGWQLFDYCSYILMFPFLISFSFLVASYIPLCGKDDELKYVKYLLCGPLCLIFSIIFLPLGFVGGLLWFLICHFGNPNSYSYYEVKTSGSKIDLNDFDRNYIIATANVCLLPEAFTKLNNNSFYITRAITIAKKMLLNEQEQLPESRENLVSQETSRQDDESCIITDFPDVDFLCLQEVWERLIAWIIIKILSPNFKYFLYDVGKHHWNVNYCCLGSGLMFISKYPIIDVAFHPFHCKTIPGSFTSLGLLQVKVSLGYTEAGKKLIGHISTTHLQSYQGTKPCILNELNEVKQWLEEFRNETEDEIMAFDIFCGDFNFDNMSPGDQVCTNHPIFEDYADPCRLRPGEDHLWAIGTEMRQIMLWDELIATPEKFKKALEDPVLRRYFLLDADVQIHTMELASLKPPFDSNGSVKPCNFGGKRRVDYVLHHKNFPLKISRYTFVTALTQLTDHLPIAMQFKIQGF